MFQWNPESIYGHRRGSPLHSMYTSELQQQLINQHLLSIATQLPPLALTAREMFGGRTALIRDGIYLKPLHSLPPVMGISHSSIYLASTACVLLSSGIAWQKVCRSPPEWIKELDALGQPRKQKLLGTAVVCGGRFVGPVVDLPHSLHQLPKYRRNRCRSSPC
jgi:hypothetical protein